MKTWFNLFTYKGETRPYVQRARFVWVQGFTELCGAPLWPRKEVETGRHPAQLPQEQCSFLVALTDRQPLPSWLVTPQQGSCALTRYLTAHTPLPNMVGTSWRRNSPKSAREKRGSPDCGALRIFSFPWGGSGAVNLKGCQHVLGKSLQRI